GLQPVLLSGDAAASVREVAGALGIEDARPRCLPEGKLNILQALQASGRRVLAVGDGINDAALLAGADVSAARAGGAPLAHRSTDLVLAGTQLVRLPQAVDLARRTRRIIRQNLGWVLA